MRLTFFLLLLWISSCLLGFAVGSVTVSKNITVSKNGDGDFTKIQAAINSVPDNNNQWIRIHVKRGTYIEKVTIPATKPYIVLEGEGQDSTVIVFRDHAHFNPDGVGTDGSATFRAHADNFVARSICFLNSYNHAVEGMVKQAVAALVSGDKVAFYDCKFLGYQDTLFDLKGRHYFARCWIEGAADFIFGSAKSIYEFCTMNSLSKKSPGWVTAHKRSSREEDTGFVFKNSMVIGGRTYLGRSWGPFARVIFFNSTLMRVVPAGWDTMNKRIDDGRRTTFAEVGCTGPGSDMSHRVPWVKNLTWPEARRFLSKKRFIQADKWLGQQP